MCFNAVCKCCVRRRSEVGAFLAIARAHRWTFIRRRTIKADAVPQSAKQLHPGVSSERLSQRRIVQLRHAGRLAWCKVLSYQRPACRRFVGLHMIYALSHGHQHDLSLPRNMARHMCASHFHDRVFPWYLVLSLSQRHSNVCHILCCLHASLAAAFCSLQPSCQHRDTLCFHCA